MRTILYAPKKNYSVRRIVTLIFSDIEIIETIVYIPIKAPHSKAKKKYRNHKLWNIASTAGQLECCYI
jgi:hypothetical protein